MMERNRNLTLGAGSRGGASLSSLYYDDEQQRVEELVYALEASSAMRRGASQRGPEELFSQSQAMPLFNGGGVYRVGVTTAAGLIRAAEEARTRQNANRNTTVYRVTGNPSIGYAIDSREVRGSAADVLVDISDDDASDCQRSIDIDLEDDKSSVEASSATSSDASVQSKRCNKCEGCKTGNKKPGECKGASGSEPKTEGKEASAAEEELPSTFRWVHITIE